MKKNVQLEQAVRDYVHKKSQRLYSLTKEEVANKLGVPTHKIAEIFATLNREGILSQPVHRQGDDRWTPDVYHFREPHETLFDIVKNEQKEKLIAFLEKGNDINAVYGKETILSHAVNKRVSYLFIQFLLDLGANPIHDRSLRILVTAIVQNLDKQAFQALLAKASDLTLTTAEGNNLLHVEAMYNFGFTSLLLEAGVPIEAKNKENETPLITACFFENVPAASKLIAHGASIKGVNHQKKSAFMYAYETNNHELMKLFLPYSKQLHRQEKILFKRVRMRLLF